MAESQIKPAAINPERPAYSPESSVLPEKMVEIPAPSETPPQTEPARAVLINPPFSSPVATSAASFSGPETLVKVEKILAENMDSVFLSMDAALQMHFKQAGEVTARQIQTLLQKAKVKAQDVIKLIINWLRIIPGVNRYYLEQEAKIKADAILNLYKNRTS